jgi:hypothetical protein
MKITAMKFLKLVTLVPYLLLAVYAFLIRKDILLGCVFLGFEAFFYYFLVRRNPHYDTLEEKTLGNAGRLAHAWMSVLLLSFLFFEEVAYRYILLGLVLVPYGLLLVWARLTGRWKPLLQSRF